jgi:hypothetical protein
MKKAFKVLYLNKKHKSKEIVIIESNKKSLINKK